MNYPLFSAFAAIIITQIVKYPIAKLLKRQSTNIKIIASTGGMPSSHSAAVTSLITSLIIQNGFRSPFVSIATVFGVIIMFDSMGVRRQSGEQGVFIMQLLSLVNTEVESNNQETVKNRLKDLNERADKLVIMDYLGHKPSEVFVGAVFGVLIGFVMQYVFYK